MELIISILEQGLIYSIMALGLYITYKILDFPDMTVSGSFPMGAAITAILLTKGVPALLTMPIGFLAGALTGIVTGLIHVKLKVRDLLAGIIMMTALYTVNLRIAGSANLPFFKAVTVFSNPLTERIFVGAFKPWRVVIVMLVIVTLVKAVLDWYMQTQSGYLLRAAGNNAAIVTAMGQDCGRIKILGLAISNGLAALSGGLFAQQQRCFEISIGTDAVVVGLASVIIGSSLYTKLDRSAGFSKLLYKLRFELITASVLAGSVLYKACVGAAMRFVKPTDLKFVTAFLFLVVLICTMEKGGKKNA